MPTPTTTEIVEMIGARKSYRTGRGRAIQALDGLDLRIEAGTVHAVLGPNGAGKSTAIAAIATLTRLDAGSVRVAGHDARTDAAAVRRSLGLVTQAPALDEALYAEENLVLFGRLHDLDRRSAASRARELLEALDLGDATGRPVSTFSGGMRRRLDIAAALVRRPVLLLLDEPTTGLDPQGRLEVWSAIRDVVARGTAVLLTTQYLEEADQLAHRITMLRKGRVAAEGSPIELKGRLGRDRVIVRPWDPGDMKRLAAILDGTPDNESVTVEADPDDPTATLLDAVRGADRAGIALGDVALRRPTLDEVFLALTGEHAADGGAAPGGHESGVSA
jgi:ABC-2 type transport system ATP-binding protein